MFLGSEDKVYILDKVENNPQQLNGRSAWAAEWDIQSNTATPMPVITNAFCASGMHFPNGSWVTFGGNGAIGPGGNISDVVGPTGTGWYSSVYKDYDGGDAIRILDPCKGGQDISQCQWSDNVTQLMKRRWYSSAEPLADGTILLLGGFVNGGYINRNWPVMSSDRGTQGGAAEPTYEFYPPYAGYTPQISQFTVNTTGLNSYTHMFLMPSGLVLLQANYSTTLWNYTSNQEYPLPDMPGQIVRVYPASGAVAMLPLTPANKWTPTILFCGGTFMRDDQWGNYSYPNAATWNISASNDCHRLTPEPTDGSPVQYVQDDNMIQPRTMGQFIALPDGTYLVINGAVNGTAGYADQTGTTPHNQMPFTMSLASGPVLQPAIYDPNAPAGSRWSNAGLGSSKIPRLYHSTAILLPDASVLIAGSNPNVDYNPNAYFPTTYDAEIFYPRYFNRSKPTIHGVPTSLGYGGDPFDLWFDASSYTGNANDIADNTTVRFMQLNSTYTVSDNGTVTLHVAQLPPSPNLITPGPVLLFVVVNGTPSNGTMITVGTGNFGVQPTKPAKSPTTTSGGSGGSSPSSQHKLSLGVVAAAAAGGTIVLAVLVALFLMCRKRKKEPGPEYSGSYGALSAGTQMAALKSEQPRGSGAFIPLQQYNNSAWNVDDNHSIHSESRMDLHEPQLPAAGGEKYPIHMGAAGDYEAPITPLKSPSGGRIDYDDYYDDPPPTALRFGHEDGTGRAS
ncbi:glyoxal oxidase N-terminus-domain-containing protein [Cantharellus anzutake]|uniref:glyoxal oxidase N-terminus-domain-containing protein n=1 Tax=Cantharellus anzutake TaxID=1750568 RepID=UPI0019082839|nr:glyoxal oxidase N-terminus-domain-containing protein [Cantharellus anzutake]KAF8339607.1 glyoxal oxidase N-terminus-domain-containing protein [Cantharellus anzutake]